MSSHTPVEAMERRLHDLADEVRQLKGEGAHKLREHAIAASDHLKDNLHRGIAYSQDSVSRRPLTFTVSAFGLGALIGMLIAWLVARE